jgi:uncharacterized protein YdaU (DUF1376 family)
MKGGRVPIHIMRWAPQDYHADEHVKLLKARRDYRTLTFYRHFLDQSFASGGDLPADPEALAAVVEMPRRDVEHALAFCLGRLIAQDGERLFQKRVRRDVATELEFREVQAEHGKKGGRPKKERQAFQNGKAEVSESETPPSPTPRAFSPAPAPAPNVLPPPRAEAPLVPVVEGPEKPFEKVPLPSWSREACDDWKAHLGTAPGGRVGAALRPLVREYGWERVRPLWQEACEQAALETDPSYFTPEVFARTFKARLAAPKGGRRKPGVIDNNRAVLARFVKGGETG